jgi:hypothetical protein
MSPPRYCECGKRIYVRIRRKWAGAWEHRGAVKGHDLCVVCWDKLRRQPKERTG